MSPPFSTCFHAGFLLSLFFQPWRRRQYVPPKRLLTLNGLHSVISRKMVLFMSYIDLLPLAGMTFQFVMPFYFSFEEAIMISFALFCMCLHLQEWLCLSSNACTLNIRWEHTNIGHWRSVKQFGHPPSSCWCIQLFCLYSGEFPGGPYLNSSVHIVFVYWLIRIRVSEQFSKDGVYSCNSLVHFDRNM
jgi:hypothetical protein